MLNRNNEFKQMQQCGVARFKVVAEKNSWYTSWKSGFEHLSASEYAFGEAKTAEELDY